MPYPVRGHFGRRRPDGRVPERARRVDAGIARGGGLAVAALSASIVIAIGLAIFPVRPKQQPPQAPPMTAPTPPAPPSTAVVADAAAVAAAPGAEAGTAAPKSADAASAVVIDAAHAATPEKVAAAEPEAAKVPEEPEPTGMSAAAKVIDKQKQADKDLAREAWRRNRPDISIQGVKTSLMIPIKGSIKGADFKISDKRRLVTVTLPKAVSMVTMKVYNLKHPAFKKLWIDQDEANAQPADGTKLRLILSQTLDPQVEITEDFVRVSIRRPDSDETAAEPRPAKRAKKAAEKSPEPSEEAAPEKENE
jgi:hypothetical protein